MRNVWNACLAFAILSVVAHLAWCPHEWPMVVAAMVTGLLALYAGLRAGVLSDPERARRLALYADEADPAPPAGMPPASGAPGRPPRVSAARVPMLFAGVMIGLVLATAWVAVRTAAREARPVSTMGGQSHDGAQ